MLPAHFPGRLCSGVHALPAGGCLEWEMVGAARGETILHFHGTPGAADGVGFFASQAAALGVRVIGVSRPGYGRSLPGDGPPATPAQVVDALFSLLSCLGVTRFGVSAWSGGAPYALELLSRPEAPLLGASLVAPAEHIRVPLRLAPRGWRRQLHSTAGHALRIPGLRGLLSAAAALGHGASRDGVRALMRGNIAAFRQGPAAYLRELDLIESDDWTEVISRIGFPRVHVFQGMLDTAVDPSASLSLAEVLPQGQLVRVEDAGHTDILVRYSREILLAAVGK
ncbi:alpha/beta fold hydrolase [Dermabacteraceae bacterium CCM 9519]